MDVSSLFSELLLCAMCRRFCIVYSEFLPVETMNRYYTFPWAHGKAFFIVPIPQGKIQSTFCVVLNFKVVMTDKEYNIG